MRLNKLDKKGRGKAAAAASTTAVKPKFISTAVIPGKVSSDMIATSFAPTIAELALQSLEEYADEMMVYGELMRDYEAAHPAVISDSDAAGNDDEEEAEVEADGTVKVTTTNNNNDDIPPPPLAPPKPLFHSQYMIDEFLGTASEISNHFSDKGGWRIHANAAKFERSLDEKYGIFRPFITNHPEIETLIRSVQRKYEIGGFSPLRQTSPPIPKSTAVILLFMMQRNNVRWDAMFLFALFLLVGLQPWALVLSIAIFQQLLNRRTSKPIGTMSPFVEPVEAYWRAGSTSNGSEEDESKTKQDILLNPVGAPLNQGEKIDGSSYDTIIIGTGPATLYAGALLARAGRKILVLSPAADASGCMALDDGGGKYKTIPFDLESANVSRISRQQELLTPALCTSSDYQGGIRFAQIGTDADGYAFEILSIPGMGTDDFESHVPFVLRSGGGKRGLMEDTATLLGDGWPASDGSVGGSLSGIYMAAAASINESAGAFYLSKILPEGSKSFQKASNYQESACRYTQSFLNKCFPMNPHLRSLMAGIGMKGENLRPNNTSMGAHITNICAALGGEGMFYPVGGPRSLCHALAGVIEQCGGRVVTSVPVKELLFDETKSTAPATGSESTEEPINPRCIGVQLAMDNQEIKIEAPSEEGETSAVINMKGFIDTFVRLLPEDIRIAHKVPMGLPALSERRPVFKVLFGLKGSADDLAVTSADYYRLPAAALARDQMDSATGQITLGDIGWSDDASPANSETPSDGVAADSINQDAESEEKSDESGQSPVRGKRTKVTTHTKLPGKSKFDAGSSWMQISFPSAKDPSWEERHGNITTCVVTVEADDDFVVQYDTKPRLFSIIPSKVADAGNRARLMDKVKKDLLELYPQLEGKSWDVFSAVVLQSKNVVISQCNLIFLFQEKLSGRLYLGRSQRD